MLEILCINRAERFETVPYSFLKILNGLKGGE